MATDGTGAEHRPCEPDPQSRSAACGRSWSVSQKPGRRRHNRRAGIDGGRKRLCLDREAEDHIGADQAACGARIHVVLADMQTVGVDCDRRLDIVIDDEACLRAGQRLLQRAAGLDHARRRRHACRAAAPSSRRRRRRPCRLDHADAGAELRIENEVERKIEAASCRRYPRFPVKRFRRRARPAHRGSARRRSLGRPPHGRPRSPATAKVASAATVALKRSSGAVAANAPTRQVSEQPSAVTCGISGDPPSMRTALLAVGDEIHGAGHGDDA